MAVLLAQSSINFTASSWKTVNSTSYLFSEVASTSSTTSYVRSSTFTPGAITVEGILLNVFGRNGTSGTFSCEIYNNTLGSQVTEVTINVTDIPAQTSGTGGAWIYFKFAATQLLLALNNYSIGIKSSTASTVSVYRDSTAGNWSRGLVTNAAGVAPAASDELIIAGPKTAAGAGTQVTVTQNNTAALTIVSLRIGALGVYNVGTAASTAYVLTQSGNLLIGHDGEFRVASLPTTSSYTHTLTSSGAAGNAFLIRAPALVSCEGNSARVRWTRAAADYSAGATSITSAVSTGWLSSDLVAMGATARSGIPAIETKTLTANAVGTALTISAVTTGKLGTGNVKAPLANLTSNVRFLGSSTTNTWYMSIGTRDCSVLFDHCDFENMGSATAAQRGINISGTASVTQSVTFSNCCFHSSHASAVHIQTTGSCNDVVISNNVFYQGAVAISTTAVAGTHNGTKSITSNLAIGATTQGYDWNDQRTTLTSNVANAGAVGMLYSQAVQATGTISLNVTECTSSQGTQINANSITIDQQLVYRANGFGILFNAQNFNITMTSPQSFGSASCAIGCSTSTGVTRSLIKNGLFGSEASFTTTNGHQHNNSLYGYDGLLFDSCTFGSGTTFTGADIQVNSANTQCGEVFRNCTFNSATRISGATNIQGLGIGVQRANGTVGAHLKYVENGIQSLDSVIFLSSPYSQRLTPSNATLRMVGTIMQFPVTLGRASVLTVYVRKSTSGDGSAYSGTQPRLIIKSQSAAGSFWTSDIVAATASAAGGVWEALTYSIVGANITDWTALEAYVDCGQTATGWVNVDNWSCT
jgi:hypothetical protein